MSRLCLYCYIECKVCSKYSLVQAMTEAREEEQRITRNERVCTLRATRSTHCKPVFLVINRISTIYCLGCCCFGCLLSALFHLPSLLSPTTGMSADEPDLKCHCRAEPDLDTAVVAVLESNGDELTTGVGMCICELVCETHGAFTSLHVDKTISLTKSQPSLVRAGNTDQHPRVGDRQSLEAEGQTSTHHRARVGQVYTQNHRDLEQKQNDTTVISIV
jgi:hypothetical protein